MERKGERNRGRESGEGGRVCVREKGGYRKKGVRERKGVGVRDREKWKR